MKPLARGLGTFAALLVFALAAWRFAADSSPKEDGGAADAKPEIATIKLSPSEVKVAEFQAKAVPDDVKGPPCCEPEKVEPFDLYPGTRVHDVVPGSAAWTMGVRKGDVIFKVASSHTANMSELVFVLYELRRAGDCQIEYWSAKTRELVKASVYMPRRTLLGIEVLGNGEGSFKIPKKLPMPMPPAD